MRYLSVLLVSFIFISSIYAQIDYDTTYSRQWNEKTEEWEPFDRIVSSYENGLITSELVQIVENDTWINYNFKTYYYNNGHIIEEFEQFWNDLKLRWEDNYRKLYSYDSEGRLIQITHQNIFKGKYINSSKEIMIYTSDGQLKEKIIQKYDQAWSNFMRYQYYYNANDLLLEENLTFWSKDSWNKASTSFQHSYDELGNLMAKTKVLINGSKHKNISREEFTYNYDGRLATHFVSNWNKHKKCWDKKNRSVFENSLNGFVVSVLNQNSDKKEWVNRYFTEYNGKMEAFTGIDMADYKTFAFHPAQFGTYATVEFDNPYKEYYHIRIMNENGQLISSTTTKKDEITIAANNLNKGLYFVELQGSNLYSGKFSIE